jgi:transcriptional regulator with XRE-family HTH domain
MQKNNELEILRNELRKYRGSMQEIALKAGVTRQWVSQVLNGFTANEAVIDAAIKVLEGHRKKSKADQDLLKRKIEAVLK